VQDIIFRIASSIGRHKIIFCLVSSEYFISTHADRQGVDISFTVILLVVCMVTDFSGENKASGDKFSTVVHRRPGQGISHFGELCFPEAKNRTNHRAAASIADRRQSQPLTARSPLVEGTGVYRQYLPSACVDGYTAVAEDGRTCLKLS